MSNRKQIAAILHGSGRVLGVTKNRFEVMLKTPVILTLNKDGIRVNNTRTIPYVDSMGYIKGLLNMGTSAAKWDRNELRRNTTALYKLYGDRAVKGTKKDSSFQIDPELPSVVKLGTNGSVTIEWHGGIQNVYDYDDTVKHMTEYGPAFTANEELTGQATEREQEKSKPDTPALGKETKKSKGKKTKGKKVKPKIDPPPVKPSKRDFDSKKKYKMAVMKWRDEMEKYQAALPNGPLKPQPAVADPEPATPAPGNSQSKKGKKTKTKSSTPRKPRGNGLGVGGTPMDDKAIKKATKALETAGKRVGARVKLLIEEFDADNDSIAQLLSLDDQAVQRNRRAYLRSLK